MKDLDIYIVEKFKINKNTSMVSSKTNIIDKICIMFGSDKEKIKEIITDWVEENEVKDIIGFADWMDLYNMGYTKGGVQLFRGGSTDLMRHFSKVRNKEIDKISDLKRFYANDEILAYVVTWNGKDVIRLVKKKND